MNDDDASQEECEKEDGSLEQIQEDGSLEQRQGDGSQEQRQEDGSLEQRQEDSSKDDVLSNPETATGDTNLSKDIYR